MYLYDEIDQQLVDERVRQFRDQTRRFLDGRLSEDDFRPLRLQNGLYLQRHAPMLRVAIPYGLLSSRQLRTLAFIARRYDRGSAHFSTRQNLQYNWPRLEDVPDILGHLAEVQMHAIQTSGNCVRNVTTDQFAGIAPDEVMNPLVWAELLRQWSTFHPEFAFLPRKFKIAVTAAEHDRAAIRVHDVGLHIRRKDGQVGFEVHVGGGQGRTPHIAALVNPFVPEAQILDYLEAIMRVYNRYGRRDNKYKARIKILVSELGEAEYIRQVEEEFAAQRPGEKINLPASEVARIHAYFAPPDLAPKPAVSKTLEAAKAADPAFARWTRVNLHPHKVAGFVTVTVSLKPIGAAPGDATGTQMDVVADLAEKYGYGDIRVSHAQNLILPHVALDDLPAVYAALDAAGLGAANESRITDMIVCPGLDYCNLANARSIPVALAVQKVFADPAYEEDIGKLHINVSGCINACGHHHVGHIGILGVDKKGEEFYQILLGGRADEKAALGEIVGPGLKADDVPAAIHRVVEFYRAERASPAEKFIDTLERLGHQRFQEALYAAG